MFVVYGMPTSGKSTLIRAGFRAIDTDDVRKAFGYVKGSDDFRIFAKAMAIVAGRVADGEKTALVTNLCGEISRFGAYHVFDVYCLPTPSREEMCRRLMTRDGISKEEAENLLISWQVKHEGEPVYPSVENGTVTILEPGTTEEYLEFLDAQLEGYEGL